MAEDRLGKLMEQRQVLEARIRREQGKARAQRRKDDTRRKILAGAVILERAEKDPALKAELHRLLAEFLVRADDRALFDLVPTPGNQVTTEPGRAADSEARSAA